jgi:ABC-type transporter Mla subunit MlaD
MRPLRFGGVGLIAALLLCWAVPALAAEETERDRYVAEAEPICKTNVLANNRIFQGVEKMVKEGKLKQASTHFFRAATAFGKTIRELAALPRPAADAARLKRWLDLLKEEKAIIQKIGKALAAEKKGKANSYAIELNRIANKANNTVLPFGFDYCRIEQSRFG